MTASTSRRIAWSVGTTSILLMIGGLVTGTFSAGHGYSFVGGTFGVTILGSVLNAGMTQPTPGAFVHAMRGALWVCAAFALLGAISTVAFLPRDAEDAVAAESQHEYPDEFSGAQRLR